MSSALSEGRAKVVSSAGWRVWSFLGRGGDKSASTESGAFDQVRDRMGAIATREVQLESAQSVGWVDGRPCRLGDDGLKAQLL